jgi:hypothetical protein
LRTGYACGMNRGSVQLTGPLRRVHEPTKQSNDAAINDLPLQSFFAVILVYFIRRRIMAKSDKEWQARTLCSDGNCIGIIGSDGRCKECGLPYDGKLPLPVAEANPDDGDKEGISADQQPAVDAESVGDASIVASDDPDGVWENRTLCADGNCIGVVGPDGRCKACGKPYTG